MSPIVASPAGNTLTLRCPATGDPPPNITWIKDDEPLEQRYMGSVSSSPCRSSCISGARFTKYLTTILRLSYDNAKVIRSTYDGRLIYKTS